MGHVSESTIRLSYVRQKEGGTLDLIRKEIDPSFYIQTLGIIRGVLTEYNLK